MNGLHEDMLFLLRCGVNCSLLTNQRVSKLDSTEKLMRMYKLSESHFVDAIIGMVLKSSGIKLPKVWEESIAKAKRNELLFDMERMKILSFMEEKGIWYLPLKGIVLKEYYPCLGMRQMSDNDILFDDSYAATVKEYMETLGYGTVTFGSEVHDVYKKPPIFNFEFHRSLFHEETSSIWEAYYQDLKSRLISDKNSLYGYHMKPEDFYIYMICHSYKHYSGNGTGIRSLLDIYVYLKKMEKHMDFSFIKNECEILGISDFEEKGRSLCYKVFGEEQEFIDSILSEEELQMLSAFLRSGVYGTYEQMIEKRMLKYTNDEGIVSKRKYLLDRVFPRREDSQYLSFFVKHWWLLPLFWVARIIRMIVNKERRKKAFIELKVARKHGCSLTRFF